MESQPLKCSVEDGEIVIRIGIETMKEAAQYEGRDPFWVDEDNAGHYFQRYKVVDPLEFAKDIVRQLQDEAEDGSSMLTNLLDKACDKAIDDGSLGVSEDEYIAGKIERFHAKAKEHLPECPWHEHFLHHMDRWGNEFDCLYETCDCDEKI